MTGLHLAQYRIDSELGRGGMGIVYRATDTKLDRTVALKVLPPHALSSEDDRARFQREARAAAKLQHAHIASIFEIGEAVPSDAPHGTEPRPFIAMEFVDGDSLAERIAKGPLKLEEAIRLCTQIAEALGAAHEAGVVHRDVKSGNVMLTKKGEAKVLDFGLAKTAASTQLTRQGSTLGTVAYMSPEQARGEEVDQRTDLWALGVVLYEMIAGRLPFAADYEQAALYGILNEDPEPLTAIRTGVPMELEAVVFKLLRKDRKLRYQTASGLIADLEALRRDGSSVRSAVHSAVRSAPVLEPVPGTRRRLSTWPIVAGVGAAALVVGFLAALLLVPSAKPPDQPALSLRLPLRADQRPLAVELHPDNRHVLITTGDSADSSPRLLVVDMETGDQRVLTDTRGVRVIDVSPDGRWVLFGTSSTLSMVPFEGGEPTRLVDSQEIAAVSWGPDGSMLFTAGATTYRLRDAAARPEPLAGASFTDGIAGYFVPAWIEPTPYVLVSRQRGANVNNVDSLDIVLLNTATGEDRVLIEGACCGQALRSGHIVYNRVGSVSTGGAQLIVQPFDLDSMSPVGRPVALAGGGAYGQYDIGSNGTFVRIGGNRGLAGGLSLVTVDLASGEDLTLPFAPDLFQSVRWSPDGNRILGQIAPQGASAFATVYDLASATSQRLSVTDSDVYSPTWSPDGTRAVAALPSRVGTVNGDLFMFATDGSGGIEPLYESAEISFNWPDWSSDGSFVVMRGRNQESRAEEIWRVDLASGEARALRKDPGLDRYPRVSPDGRLIVYQKTLDGQRSAWVMTPDGSNRWLVAQDAGAPVWDPSGLSVYFERGNQVLRVPVEFRNGFRTTGSPETVFGAEYSFLFDVSPDGRRLLLAAALNESARGSNELEVVVNWTRLLPTVE
jgi:serine/threonine-protein kinase